MVPLNDDNPVKITPWVVYSLILINFLVFFHELSLSNQQLNYFFYNWAVVPCQLTNICPVTIPPPPLPSDTVAEWVTLITSQFLHGGWAHILGNMLFLWIFGNNVEERLGHIKFLIFYLTCGVLASLTQWFFGPASVIPSLGASGAIAGVMGAYIITFPGAKIFTLVPIGFFITTWRIPAWVFLGLWFLQQTLASVSTLGVTSDTGGVAYWAHAGGFVFGAILGPLMGMFSDSTEN